MTTLSGNDEPFDGYTIDEIKAAGQEILDSRMSHHVLLCSWVSHALDAIELYEEAVRAGAITSRNNESLMERIRREYRAFLK